MAGIIERFQKGFELTEDEWWDRKDLSNFLKGYTPLSPKSIEFHPTIIERVRRGVGHIVYPQRMRNNTSDIQN